MTNEQNPIDYQVYGPLYDGWARGLSFVVAAVLSVSVLALPQLVATDTAGLKHGSLSLGMAGICIGFVHGIGYVPETRLWRWLFSPYVGWPVMGLCIYWWLIPLL